MLFREVKLLFTVKTFSVKPNYHDALAMLRNICLAIHHLMVNAVI